MWILLRAITRHNRLGDGPGIGARPDPAELISQYRQAQAMATAVTEYYKAREGGVTKGTPVQKEAHAELQDLLALSRAGVLDAGEVKDVKGILAKIDKGKPLTQGDVEALRAVVEKLGERLLAADKVGAAMPVALQKIVAASPNADRALEAYKALKELQAQDPNRPPRITDAVVGALTSAVARPGSTDSRGQAGLMGTEAALQAARILAAMPAADYARVEALLAGAAAPPPAHGDPAMEQALILESVAANYQLYPPGQPVNPFRDNPDFLARLESFATAIHQLPSREEVVRQTSVVATGDGGAGLQQRYANSCGPTIVQMARATLDPLYAFQLNQGGPLQGQDTDKRAGEEQAAMLRQMEIKKPVPQALFEAYKQFPQSINAALHRLEAERDAAKAKGADVKDLTERIGDLGMLRKYVLETGFKPTEEVQRQLERAAGEMAGQGDPIDMAAVERARAIGRWDMESGGAGIQPAQLPTLLEVQTGVEYALGLVQTDASGPGKRAIGADSMVHAAAALAAGRPVPLVIMYTQYNGTDKGSGHLMLMTDVRGLAPDREFLVSDPQSGTSRWATEQDLSSGAFLGSFGLNPGYVRSMGLRPEEVGP